VDVALLFILRALFNASDVLQWPFFAIHFLCQSL